MPADSSELPAPWWRGPCQTIAWLWIFGCGFVYYARFSLVFYRAHEQAITEAWDGLRTALGW